MRTHYCGELNRSHIDQQVTLCGWAHRRRDHGGIIFLDIRDIKGICQVVVNPENKVAFDTADNCRNEFVIKVTGKVLKRPDGTINTNMVTGEIELEAKIREQVPSIREAGFGLVRDGLTTIEEVLRVTSV